MGDEYWVVTLSCPGCLAVIELNEWHGWEASEAVSSSVVLRLRDRLAAARTGDALEGEVRALFSDYPSALVLGTPELFEFVSEAFGHSVRLRERVATWPGSDTPGGAYPPSVDALHSVAKSPPKNDAIVLLEGETLALTGVRSRRLACTHGERPVVVHPDLVDPA